MRKRLLGFVGVLLFGCGSSLGHVTVQELASTHPSLPAITIERLQQCVADYGGQLESGRYDFNPIVKVDTDGFNRGVETPGIPDSAPDFAACTRIALTDMAIPDGVLPLRRTETTATNDVTPAQRLYMGNPAVAVVVVVGLSEIVLEAGAYTVLFAVTVKVLDKAADDVAEAIKKRRIPWKDACTTHYENCIESPAGRARGNVWNQTRCGLCKSSCDLRKIWPPAVIVGDEWESCY